ncbi:MAG: Nif11-like leader peptide family RiPP precursor [Faecalibacterium sp.]
MKNELNSAAMLRKLTACQTTEEVMALVKEAGQELTEQEAAQLLEELKLQSRDLSDKELELVAGGCTVDDPSGARATYHEKDSKGIKIGGRVLKIKRF